MAKLKAREQTKGNRLLAVLPAAECEKLLPELEEVTLADKELLYDTDQLIKYVWFPKTAVISLLAMAEKKVATEVATVGNEGMIGLPLFFGINRNTIKAITQVPGTAKRMKAEAFRDAVKFKSSLHSLLQRYAHALMNQIAQSVACNRTHSLKERCARWLLMTHDRVLSDEFILKQEFLAQMLGVRRAGVSNVASELRKEKIIKYSRGKIIIFNRKNLEAMTCRCYRIIKEEYDKLLG